MTRHTPNIIYLSGQPSSIHLEAPHATQATAEEFKKMLRYCIRNSKYVEEGTVLTNHNGMSLMWRANKDEFKRKGLSFERSCEKKMFICNPKDRKHLESIVLEKLKRSYDTGTLNLIEDLQDALDVPALIDGHHRYVGGDLNRSPGTEVRFNKGDNLAKWGAWQEAEYQILEQSPNGPHVAVALHSMDKRPHRKFFNEETGHHEFDREIIIGTRFGASVDPAILQSFFFAFETALEHQFENERVPRVKIDLEFIGDKVLKERRGKHQFEGMDVHYIQIEFMKYLLRGKNYPKIVTALKEAIERLAHMIQQNNLEVPRNREHYNSEYTDWSERISATQWKFQTDFEALSSDVEPFVRLSSVQREYLHVELLDYVEDSEGRRWLVKAQYMNKARRYTEDDRVTVHGREVDSLILVRK